MTSLRRRMRLSILCSSKLLDLLDRNGIALALLRGDKGNHACEEGEKTRQVQKRAHACRRRVVLSEKTNEAQDTRHERSNRRDRSQS